MLFAIFLTESKCSYSLLMYLADLESQPFEAPAKKCQQIAKLITCCQHWSQARNLKSYYKCSWLHGSQLALDSGYPMSLQDPSQLILGPRFLSIHKWHHVIVFWQLALDTEPWRGIHQVHHFWNLALGWLLHFPSLLVHQRCKSSVFSASCRSNVSHIHAFLRPEHEVVFKAGLFPITLELNTPLWLLYLIHWIAWVSKTGCPLET